MVCIICLCLWIDVTPCLPRRGVTPGCYAGVLRRGVTLGCYAGVLRWGCRAEVAAPGLLYCYIVTLYCYIATFLNCHDATLPHCYIATFS